MTQSAFYLLLLNQEGEDFVKKTYPNEKLWSPAESIWYDIRKEENERDIRLTEEIQDVDAFTDDFGDPTIPQPLRGLIVDTKTDNAHNFIFENDNDGHDNNINLQISSTKTTETMRMFWENLTIGARALSQNITIEYPDLYQFKDGFRKEKAQQEHFIEHMRILGFYEGGTPNTVYWVHTTKNNLW